MFHLSLLDVLVPIGTHTASIHTTYPGTPLYYPSRFEDQPITVFAVKYDDGDKEDIRYAWEVHGGAWR